jgi:hypothetical protein
VAKRDIIVIGASAGGVQALTNLVADLPADLPAAVFIVLHIPAHIPSFLHAFSAEALSDGQSQMLEVALWSAVRALEEQLILARRIVERARKSNRQHAAMAFERRAREAEEHSSMIRQLLLAGEKGDIGETVLQTDD